MRKCRKEALLTRMTPVSCSTYCFSVSIRSFRGLDFLVFGIEDVEGVLGVKGAVEAEGPQNVWVNHGAERGAWFAHLNRLRVKKSSSGWVMWFDHQDRERHLCRLEIIVPGCRERKRGRTLVAVKSVHSSVCSEQQHKCSTDVSAVTCYPSSVLMSEPSSEPSTTSKLTAELRYNVRWMADTFDSRSAVESLLGPQRAAGNISFHDYDAAMSFLPGYHRLYGVCVIPPWSHSVLIPDTGLLIFSGFLSNIRLS